MLHPGFELINRLLEVLPAPEHETLAKNLIFIGESSGKALHIFAHFVEKELRDAEGHALFRVNSFSTKLFQNYAKLHGLQYLFSILAGSMVGIEHNVEQREMEMEVDPKKLEEDADLASNKWQLLYICQKIFGSILRTVDEMP